MGVPPTGAGPAGLNLFHTVPAAPIAPTGAPLRAAANQPGADTYVSAAPELSPSDLTRLTAVLEPPQSAHAAGQVDALVQAALSAASAGDVMRAADHVAAIATLEPHHAAAILADHRLDPIRETVETTFSRIVSVARLDAESRIGEASQASEATGLRQLADWEAKPEVLVGIASRLFESGGHANYVRAAALAQVVIDAARWVPAEASLPPVGSARTTARLAEDDLATVKEVWIASRQGWSTFRRVVEPRLRMLWLRAPLLILLLSWLALGAAAGVIGLLIRKYRPEDWSPSVGNGAVEIWVMGFLAVVLFGFYVRVRNVRF
jgi:hypothetical protein